MNDLRTNNIIKFTIEYAFDHPVRFQKRSDSRSTANNKKYENAKVKVIYACIRLSYLMD